MKIGESEKKVMAVGKMRNLQGGTLNKASRNGGGQGQRKDKRFV